MLPYMLQQSLDLPSKDIGIITLTFGTNIIPKHPFYQKLITSFKIYSECINDVINTFNNSNKFKMYESISNKYAKEFNLESSNGKIRYKKLLTKKGIKINNIFYDLQDIYMSLSNKKLYMKHIPSQSIRCYLKQLATGYFLYFTKQSKKYPKLKYKKYVKGKYLFKTIMTFPQRFKIDYKNMKISLPKYKIWIDIHNNGISSKDLELIYDKVKNVNLIYVPHKKQFIIQLMLYTNKCCNLLQCDDIIGIDLGCKSLAVDSNGTKYDIPIKQKNKIKRIENIIKHIHSILSKILEYVKEHKWSKSLWKKYKKYTDILITLKQKIQNIHRDCINKTVLQLIKNNDILIFENLKIQDIQQSTKNKKYIKKNINKSIVKRQLYKFKMKLIEKSKHLKKLLFIIDPKHTSKSCSYCGNLIKNMEVTNRTFTCPSCGLKLDRDHNAAINILKKALNNNNYICYPNMPDDNEFDIIKNFIKFTLYNIFRDIKSTIRTQEV